jgi:two-component system, NarL family, response regulator YdfI
VIRLALAAPSAMLLAGLESLLARDGAFTIVESTTQLDELGEMLDTAEIDAVVVVVDDPVNFHLPGASSPDGEGRPAAAIILLLDSSDLASLGDWLRRGARGVLPRDAEPREIIAAIEAVAAGLVVLPASELAALQSATPRGFARLSSQPQSASLSPREREILSLLAEGLGNKIVAARLGISEHTVKTHVASIFTKLGADTRAEAVAIGARTGLILL